jgi:hypothetical protein
MPGNSRAQAVILLASGWSINGAAGKVGVNEKTVRLWLKSDDFRRRVSELRKRMTDRCVGKLSAAMTRAAVELRRLLRANDGRLRLAAAKCILEQSRLTELADLSERVEKLERGTHESQRFFDQTGGPAGTSASNGHAG